MTTYCSFPWHASGLKYVCMQTRSGTQGFDGRSGIWGVLFLSDGWRLCCYTDGERKADAGSSRHQEYQGARGQKRMEDRFTEREQHSGDSLGFGGGGCSFQTKKVQNCKEIIIKYNHQISSAPCIKQTSFLKKPFFDLFHCVLMMILLTSATVITFSFFSYPS